MKPGNLRAAAIWGIGFALIFGIMLLYSPIDLTLPWRYEGYNYNAKVNFSRIGSHNLATACKAYRRVPESGNQYPKQLGELLDPPFGGPPFIEGGERALLDAWGRPYKYVLVKNADGELEPCVWAEWEYNGRPTAAGWGWNGESVGKITLDTIPR
jgi:hypothetical protein